MKFRIDKTTEEKFRPTDTIPLQYCGNLSSFAKPVLLKSTPIDILYHNRSVGGCTLRDIIFYVRESVTILTSIGNPMTSIHCMLKGEMDIQLNGYERIPLHQGEYNILQVNKDEHAIVLHPGVYELFRYDYREQIIKKNGKLEWLNKFSNNESAIYEHGEIGERMIEIQEELKHTVIITPEQEEWFYIKLRKYLLLVLDQHQEVKEQ